MADPEHDFFLGGDLDPATGNRTGSSTTYDPDDLVTHGVVVGMTGSGKTGLGIVLLEEALLRGIPCLVIDPKGDLTNLALRFPELRADDFLPWLDPAALAASPGRSPGDVAADTATAWREGLEGWGIGSDRLNALARSSAVTIYTPGSTSGVPLDLLGSLAAPAEGTDLEARQDEIAGFVGGLLGMVGVDADPLTSPAHILLSNLVDHAWSQGRDLDIAGLLALVQDPPMRRLGVLDLDTFYPPRERAQLVLRLNGLLASPSFQAWHQGAPLDIASLLHTPDGRPRAAVVTLSHLSDQERQFVVALLFAKLITWMRSQPGTSALRALAYMDEVFGFVPPNGLPPAKTPILTVLKQARAFGIGLVLATQNPVDLDYKALSNAGTWLVGRLQTERDKARLLDGLTSASGATDPAAIARLVSGLGKRQFVLHSTSAAGPRLFTTRWAMSYLRGPLTRDQITTLTADAPERTQPAGVAHPASEAGGPVGHAAAAGAGLASDESPVAPVVAEGVHAWWLDPSAPWASSVGVVPDGRRLEAGLIARVRLVFDDARNGIEHADEWEAVLHPVADRVDWAASQAVDYDDRDLRDEPGPAPEGVVYALPTVDLTKRTWFREAERALVRHVRATQRLELRRNQELGLLQRPGEADEAFALRCQTEAETRMDADAAKLREQLTRQTDRIRAALEEAQDRVHDAREQQRRQQTGTLVRTAGSLLSSFLGGRRSTRSLTRSLGSAAGGVLGHSSSSVDSAERAVVSRQGELDRLEQELADKLAALDRRWDEVARSIDTVAVRPDAGDVTVERLGVVWLPVA